MTLSPVPRTAAWLLRQLAPGLHCEALTGDLAEEVARGRSKGWYWRQAIAAVLVGTWQAIRSRKATALGGIVTGWVVAETFAGASVVILGYKAAVPRSLYWNWGSPDAYVFYGAMCLCAAASGAIVALFYHRDLAAILVAYALSIMLVQLLALLQHLIWYPPAFPAFFYPLMLVGIATLPSSALLGGFWVDRRFFRLVEHSRS